jgi:hypothetical protein
LSTLNKNNSQSQVDDIRPFSQHNIIMSPYDATSSTSSPSTETSIRIFRRYIRTSIDAQGQMQLDARAVVGRACFEHWKECHKPSRDCERGFQRSLTAHLTKSDGRRPFQPDEEAAVLKVLRQKKVWSAFAGTDISIGINGFRAHGFHERCSSGRARSQTSDVSHTYLQSCAEGEAREREDDTCEDDTPGNVTRVPWRWSDLSGELRAERMPGEDVYLKLDAEGSHEACQVLRSTSPMLDFTSFPMHEDGGYEFPF